MKNKTIWLISSQQLVSEAWCVVRAHWREFLHLVKWYILPLIIVHAIGQLIYFGGYTLLLTIVFYVFFGLLALLVQLCLIRAMKQYSQGESGGFSKKHLLSTLVYLPAAVGIVAIVVIVSLLAILIVSLPMVVLTAFSLHIPGASVITFLLILAVFFALSVYFSFPLYVLID